MDNFQVQRVSEAIGDNKVRILGMNVNAGVAGFLAGAGAIFVLYVLVRVILKKDALRFLDDMFAKKESNASL